MVANPDFDNVLREALARRIGEDLYHEATRISSRTVEALSAVIGRLSYQSDYGSHVAVGFAEAMVAERAIEYLEASAGPESV